MPLDLDDVLICPLCSGPLSEVRETTLGCPSGHRFDAARQGYYNLITGKGTAFQADTAEMVDARSAFLGRGHYAPLRDAIADAVAAQVDEPAVILDAGAGTGYYLKELHRRQPGSRSVALDISKFALRRTARQVPDGVSVVWDVWQPLPVRESSVDVILNVLAPRNPGEFRRVMRPGGTLVVATPLPGHLAEIASAASLLEVPADKAAQLTNSFAGLFEPASSQKVEFALQLTPADVHDAALMGPAARHLDRGALRRRVAMLPDTSRAHASFTVQAFRPVHPSAGSG